MPHLPASLTCNVSPELGCPLGTLAVTCPNLNACSPLKLAFPAYTIFPLSIEGHTIIWWLLCLTHTLLPVQQQILSPLPSNTQYLATSHHIRCPNPGQSHRPVSLEFCNGNKLQQMALFLHTVARVVLLKYMSGSAQTSLARSGRQCPAGYSSCSSDPTSYPSLPGSVSPATRLIPVPPPE